MPITEVDERKLAKDSWLLQQKDLKGEILWLIR